MEKIAVDAMGGDFAPLEIVLGSIQAVREFKIPVVLVGDKEQILTILKNNHEENNPLIEIHHASEVIEMGEHPGLAYRKKKDASVSSCESQGMRSSRRSGIYWCSCHCRTSWNRTNQGD
jgi:glycerol-3-phosphate acyltransferase PlsX